MIDKDLVGLFRKHRKEQNELKMNQRLIYKDQDFIFAENIGNPRVMKMVAIRLQRLMRLMDINKHITPHGFRHTHTSLLIEAGGRYKRDSGTFRTFRHQYNDEHIRTYDQKHRRKDLPKVQ